MDSSAAQQLLATNPNLLHLSVKHWGGQDILSSPFPPLVPQKKPCGNADGEFSVFQPSLPLPAQLTRVHTLHLPALWLTHQAAPRHMDQQRTLSDR